MTRKQYIMQAATDYYGGVEYRAAHHFMAGAEWADVNPAWRSIEDELPPLHRHLLVVRTEQFAQGTGNRDGGVDFQIFLNDEHRENWLRSITHWMPLPLPPSTHLNPNLANGNRTTTTQGA